MIFIIKLKKKQPIWLLYSSTWFIIIRSYTSFITKGGGNKPNKCDTSLMQCDREVRGQHQQVYPVYSEWHSNYSLPFHSGPRARLKKCHHATTATRSRNSIVFPSKTFLQKGHRRYWLVSTNTHCGGNVCPRYISRREELPRDSMLWWWVGYGQTWV